MLFSTLSTNSRIYCDVGAVFAKQLANRGQSFFVLSHDAALDKIVAKKAHIEGHGRGVVLQVKTNVGTYEVSQEQSFRLHEGSVKRAISLEAGDKLLSCELENVDGFIFVQTGKGITPLHELVEAEMSSMFRLAIPQSIKPKHRMIQEVIDVQEAGVADLHYIYIDCLSKNDHTFPSGHNYLMWPDGTSFGSGVLLH